MVLGILFLIITGCNPTKHVPAADLFLKKNKIIVDTRKIDKDDLESLVKQKTNKKILGLFRFHLWVNNRYKKTFKNCRLCIKR